MNSFFICHTVGTGNLFMTRALSGPVIILRNICSGVFRRIRSSGDIKLSPTNIYGDAVRRC